MPTYAGIVRISHLGARKAGSDRLHSDRDQEKAIRAAVPPGDRLDLLPAEYDVSGGLPLDKRPALRDAVAGVEAGRYAGIIVAYQSRLGREVEHEEAVWKRIEAAGGNIIIALDGTDSTTVDGRMVRRIKSAMNAAERERHKEAFDVRCQEATALGIWQRRQTPLGYVKDPQTRNLVPSGDAKMVRKAFRDRIAGKPISAIARDLQMTPSGVRQLLRNRVYLGELNVRTYTNATAHPAIVDEDTFDRVQYARITRPPRVNKHPALLGSLVRCAGCGHIMARTGRAYACSKHHSDGECPAPSGITLKTLNEYVTGIALKELTRLSVESVKTDSGAEAARSALRAARHELAVYLEATAAAGLSADVMTEGLKLRQANIEQRRDELDAILSAQTAPVLDDPLTAWEQMHEGQRNTVLCGLLEAVVIQRCGRGKNVPVQDRARIIKHGAGLFAAYRYGGEAMPSRAVFPDADDPRLLRV